MSNEDKFIKLIMDRYRHTLSQNFLSIDLNNTHIRYGNNELYNNAKNSIDNPDASVLFSCGYLFEVRESRYFIILSEEWTKIKRHIKLKDIVEW